MSLEEKEKIRRIKSPIVPTVDGTPLTEPGIGDDQPSQSIVYTIQLPNGRWVTRPSDF